MCYTPRLGDTQTSACLCDKERSLTRHVMGIYRAPANGVTVQQRWRKDARALEQEEEVCTPCPKTHPTLWCQTVIVGLGSL